MKQIPIIILASFLSSHFAFAEATNAPEKTVTIGTKDAGLFYNQTATVTGKVAQVTFQPKAVFLNLDEPYPKSPFTAVIFPATTNEFPGLSTLKGKDVEMTGIVKNYQDKPEMVLSNASQLKIVEPEKK